MGAVLGAWSWALAALTPPLLAAAACAAAAASFALPVRPSLVLIGIVLGQAAIAAQPEPAALRDWTSGEVLGVSGRSVLLKTPQGHLWTQLWPKPPPVGSLVAGRLRASAPRQALPGSWPSHAQAILSRAHQARMHPWVSLTPSEAMPTALAHVRHRGLIWALATGDRSAIDDATTDLLRRTGAAHLLAISGLHVGMVAALAWAIAWALTRGLTSGPWPPIARVLPSLMSAIAACLYAQAVGWPVSTQRAAMMVAGACACAIIGRRVDPWQILGIAALAPLFRTMTEAISDDTAVASAVASLFLHLLTHDYAFLNDRTARLGGTVSHGAAMFASALISSRLENLDAVFADALLAAVLFILFPFARRDVRVVAGADAHVALTLAAHLAALAALRAIPAASGRAVFVGGYLVAALAVAFAAPVALVRAMRFKRQINGPWDEAKVAAE